MKYPIKAYLGGLLTVVSVLAAVWVLDRSEQERFREQNRASVLSELSAVRARLEAALNQRLFLTRGLVSYVSTVNPDIDQKTFERLTQAIVARESGIRSVVLYKNTAVSHIYPLAGNEATIGFSPLSIPEEREAIARAINNKKTIVAGPIHLVAGQTKLVEGGMVFIARTPIFLTPPGKAPESGSYWGLTGIIIDQDTLFKEAGLFEKSAKLKYTIRGKDGLGAAGKVFFGDAAIFQHEPVLLSVTLPNGSWQLAAVPAAGWPLTHPTSQWLWMGGGWLALLAGGLVFILISAPARLQEAVNRATVALRKSQEELQQTNGDLQQAKEALAEAKEQLEAVLNAVPGSISWIGSNGVYLGVNRHLSESLNLSPDEIVGKEVGFFENSPKYVTFMQAFLASHEPSASQEIPVCVNNEERYYLMAAQKYQNGSATVTVGIEVTDRHKAQEALRESEATNRAIVAAIPDLLIRAKGDGTYLNIIGTERFTVHDSSHFIIGTTVQESLPREQAQQRMHYIQQALQTGEVQRYEHQLVIDGKLQDEEIRIVALGTDEVLIIVRDITDRKRAEESLRIAEENYRSIFENALEGIFQSTPEGHFINVNPAMARIYGYDSPQEMTASVTDIQTQLYVNPGDRKQFGALIQEYGQVKEVEYQAYRKDGSILWVGMDARAVRDSSGKLLYYEGIVQDISQRKQQEEELRRQLQELRIEIDHQKREREVTQITQSDYFQELQKEVTDLQLDEFWS